MKMILGAKIENIFYYLHKNGRNLAHVYILYVATCSNTKQRIYTLVIRQLHL